MLKRFCDSKSSMVLQAYGAVSLVFPGVFPGSLLAW